jgi:hypothetical protein
MCECQKYFEPDAKLKKMLILMLIIMIINVLLTILTAIFIDFSMCFELLIQVLVLFCGYQSLLYTYLAMYIFFGLLNGFLVVRVVGIIIQQTIIEGSSQLQTGKQYTAFSILLVTLVFQIFAIVLIFPIYKEMKAQLYERTLGVSLDPENVSNENNNSNNINEEQQQQNAYIGRGDTQYNPPATYNQVNSSNNRGFVAFGGRGTAVGGS